MGKEFPDLRVQPPPEFLHTKYGGTEKLFEDAGLRSGSRGLSLQSLTARFPDFVVLFGATQEQILLAAGEAGISQPEQALRFVKWAQRLLIFQDPDAVTSIVRRRVKEIADGLPRTLKDLEYGKNGRDVLDPFMVALVGKLLGADNIEVLVQHLVSHKCLMHLEDLIGNLHQDVLGSAAGKRRVAEPEGTIIEGRRNKEVWDKQKNPYPGADARFQEAEFYQIKNKTGSAKGSDGEKLGRQFLELKQHYPGSRRFYISMIGTTLSGHRSMGAFLRKDSDAEVLVGLPAFQQLGHHRDTPKIELDFVSDEFESIKDEIGYDFSQVVTNIVAEWKTKHGASNPVDTLLFDMVVGSDPEEQQSRTFIKKEVVRLAKRLLREARREEANQRIYRFGAYTIIVNNGQLTVEHNERGQILVTTGKGSIKASLRPEDIDCFRAEAARHLLEKAAQNEGS